MKTNPSAPSTPTSSSSASEASEGTKTSPADSTSSQPDPMAGIKFTGKPELWIAGVKVHSADMTPEEKDAALTEVVEKTGLGELARQRAAKRAQARAQAEQPPKAADGVSTLHQD